MNLKFNGRNTNKFWCKKHLMEQLNITKEQWNDNVKDFKKQGCALF
jgi:biotin operon repressor